VRPHPVKRLVVGSVAALLPVLLAAAPATATVTTRSAGDSFQNFPPPKLEMGFFEQWGIYGRGFTLASADREGEIADLTDLDYAFGGVEPLDGATHNSAGVLAVSNEPIQSDPTQPDYNPVVCSSLDTWADYQDPYLTDVDGGSGVAPSGLAGNFEQLAELEAKYPRLKVIMSLGGYNGSAFFSAAAATPASRQAFVSSCIKMFIRGDVPAASGLPLTGSEQSIFPAHPDAAAGIFDGFDIDWEYPADNNGAPGNLYSPQDTQNFVLLLREFRTQLDALSRTTGQRYTLTVEMPAGLQNAQYLEPAAMARYVNDEVIMDYDFQGPWEAHGPTNFESNLYESPNAPNSAAEPLISGSSTVSYYEQQGVQRRQLVMGMPYYGHGWAGVPSGAQYGLYEPASGPATSPDINSLGQSVPGLDGADPAGTSDYYELVNQAGYSWHFDPVTGATWLYNPATQVFWSVENPAEMFEKALYIDRQGLAGASVWALEGDSQNALTSALTAGLQQGAPFAHEP
jgi:chitinase